MMPNSKAVLTVTSLNSYVRTLLEDDLLLSWFRLEGEISGFREVASGHWYFTLKDDMAQVSCVMYRSSAARCSIEPKNGMHVQISGKVSIYERTGAYQVIAQSMRPAGIGSIYQALEQLKSKLQAEGLFNEDRKRPLPMMPRKIAVVTSRTGAVIHDICRVAAERNKGVPIVLIPTLVQGEEAAPMIADALSAACRIPQVDVIILARGGGSMEDLWCFNEECVVRAIAACTVPVISAVGHESDYTLADMVSDRRASTPSNAAEIAVPEKKSLMKQLSALRERLNHIMNHVITGKKMAVMSLSSRLDDQNPAKVLAGEKSRLREMRLKLDRAISGKITAMEKRTSENSLRLENAAGQNMAKQRFLLENMRIRLKLLNPQNVLDRGYVIATSGKSVVMTRNQAEGLDFMELHFKDGSMKVLPAERE